MNEPTPVFQPFCPTCRWIDPPHHSYNLEYCPRCLHYHGLAYRMIRDDFHRRTEIDYWRQMYRHFGIAPDVYVSHIVWVNLNDPPTPAEYLTLLEDPRYYDILSGYELNLVNWRQRNLSISPNANLHDLFAEVEHHIKKKEPADEQA